MFEIKAYVEDKDLGRAKRALIGIARGAIEDRPLTHAVFKAGQLQSTAPAGNPFDVLYAMLGSIQKGAPITHSSLKELIHNAGGNPTAVAYYTQRLIKAKAMKTTKQKGSYVKT